MIERDRLFLSHIQDALAEIEDYTSGGRDAFMSDRKTQSSSAAQRSP